MTDCGHTHHVGTCAGCQRAQLARWRAQLLEASRLQWSPRLDRSGIYTQLTREHSTPDKRVGS
jgi:hypothetical protein